MEIVVTGKHLEITPAIKQYATEKVAKLPRYFDRIHMIEVLASKSDNHHEHEAEIIVHLEHADPFVGRVKNADLYACIDAAVDKLERQLTDHKEIVRKRKGKTSMSG
jgi:putative sigma-54 modulation protein